MRRFLLLLLCTLWPLTSAIGQATTDQQIAAAISPLPGDLRDGATVMGYTDGGELTTLREGTNDMICLADEPGNDRWHVACYHESMSAFMERGRELRAEGKSRDEVNAMREAEARDGSIPLPEQSAALYSLTGSPDAFDYETGKVNEASPLYVVYIPYATEETTGLSPRQMAKGAPWIMDAGKPWAHIMIIPAEPRSDN